MSKWIDKEWLLDFFEPYPDDYAVSLGALRACVDDAPAIETKIKVRYFDEDESVWKIGRVVDDL